MDTNRLIASVDPDKLRALGEIAAKIGKAMIESIEAAKEALRELLAPLAKAVSDIARELGELIAEDIHPKTIPPRAPVRCIGCRPVTKSRKPQIIRTGCRHK